MKQIIKYLTVATAVLFAAFSVASAQGDRGGKSEWQEKMKAEKVAFLTAEMDLTPEESAAFWPVYNYFSEKKAKAFGKVIKTYKALDESVKAEKSEKEIASALKDYLDACSAQKDIDSKAAQQYQKVVSVEKVAKLFLGEEKFRRRQIHRLHSGDARKDNNKNQ